MLCYVMLCYVMLCYVMLCYVMLCYVMLCYVMLCYVMLCYVMLCYVMLCYVLSGRSNLRRSWPIIGQLLRKGTAISLYYLQEVLKPLRRDNPRRSPLCLIIAKQTLLQTYTELYILNGSIVSFNHLVFSGNEYLN